MEIMLLHSMCIVSGRQTRASTIKVILVAAILTRTDAIWRASVQIRIRTLIVLLGNACVSWCI